MNFPSVLRIVLTIVLLIFVGKQAGWAVTLSLTLLFIFGECEAAALRHHLHLIRMIERKLER